MRSGSLFLGTLVLGVAAMYLRDHGRWWAIIPAEVMLALAASAVGGATDAGAQASGALIFAGLALTFVLVAVLPTGQAGAGGRGSPPRSWLCWSLWRPPRC